MNEIDELRTALDSYVTRVPASPDRLPAFTRRRRRRRTGLVVAAAVGVVVAVAAPLTAVRLHRAAPSPAGPAVLDPMVSRLSPTWLPPGDAVDSVSTSAEGEVLTTKDNVNVAIAPAGGVLPGVELRSETAPPVNGADAWWWCITDTAPVRLDTRPSCASLLWQWAPDAWAVITPEPLDGSSGAGLRDQVHRIAEGLRTDGSTPRRLPYTLAGTPSGYDLVVTTWADGRTALRLRTPHPRDSAADRGLAIGTNVAGVNRGPDRPQATTEVDGVPVRVAGGSGASPDGSVDVWDFHGLDVEIYSTLLDGPYAGPDGALAALRAMRVVPDPADQSDWTSRLFG